MTAEFLPEARQEFIESVAWYETREVGLGRRFREEVNHVVKRIQADPMLWREREQGYRRVNCPVFPHYIAYIIRDNKVIIVAVAHGRRMPEYWIRWINVRISRKLPKWCRAALAGRLRLANGPSHV